MILKTGILIAIEGIDGSGKSTLAKKLQERFLQSSVTAILTKEPGGTELGKQLRAILQEQTIPLTPVAEFLLFAADRAQHMATLIKPALEEKKLIISDRMADSAMAYQGYGRGLDRTMIEQVNRWAMQQIKATPTLYVDVDLATAERRRAARAEKPTSFEQEQMEFMQRIIDGYRAMYQGRPDVILIDGAQSPEQVFDTTWKQLISYLTQHNLLAL